MIKPGMFISDRYEIIDLVGSGGMADVYKAKCHRLNRYVAIKILKSEFSSDKNFVQKFRAEAQSVAGLSHPNIVSVYDVGDDDGLHYIVMELVEGITLKKYIERKKRLEIKEAVGIAIQICQGMEAAHTHHIIHRDIKPQNIIISREGKVKVADFGIAKAATSNTISQNAIGSVHYLSPEQARGGYSDERSDIYSLGVTLYEMLTGQVPFAGDNSVSVALLHIQSEATPVQILNPEVPTSVDRIVQKCMQKKPERRYQSASELIRDLKRSIINPDGEYVQIGSNAPVSDSPTRIRTEEELLSVKNAANASAPRYEEEEREPVHHTEERNKPVKRRRRNDDDELDAMDSTLEKVLTAVSVLFAIALICVILYLLWQFFFKEDTTVQNTTDAVVTQDLATPTASLIIAKPTPTDVPVATPTGTIEGKVLMTRVVGLTFDDAKVLLNAVSTEFEIVYEEEYSEEYDAGIVIAQYPPENILVERNAQVKLTISAGGEAVELISIDGKTSDSGIKLLEAYGYNVIELHEYSSEVTAGSVIRTEPAAGEFVQKNSDIVVYVSDGADPNAADDTDSGDESGDQSGTGSQTGDTSDQIAVPSVLGVTLKTAKKRITSAGLTVGSVSYAYSDYFEDGDVCKQSIDDDDLVAPGTVIDLVVSLGKEAAATATPTPAPTSTPTPTPAPTSTPTPTPILPVG